MTIKEVLKHNTGELWITAEEDPNNARPDIIIKPTYSESEYGWLSDELLNTEVHLMVAEGDVLFVSTFYYKR